MGAANVYIAPLLMTGDEGDATELSVNRDYLVVVEAKLGRAYIVSVASAPYDGLGSIIESYVAKTDASSATTIHTRAYLTRDYDDRAIRTNSPNGAVDPEAFGFSRNVVRNEMAAGMIAVVRYWGAPAVPFTIERQECRGEVVKQLSGTLLSHHTALLWDFDDPDRLARDGGGMRPPFKQARPGPGQYFIIFAKQDGSRLLVKRRLPLIGPSDPCIAMVGEWLRNNDGDSRAASRPETHK